MSAAGGVPRAEPAGRAGVMRVEPMHEYLPPLSLRARRWVRFGALLVVLGLLAGLMYRLSSVLTPIVAALALAYILNPLVTWLERQRIPRIRSIILLYALGGLLLVAALVLVVPMLIEQGLRLAQNLPDYAEKTREWLLEHFPSLTSAALSEQARNLVRQAGLSSGQATVNYVAGVLVSVTTILTMLVLIPLYTFFFLWRFNDIVQAVHDHLPAASRPTVVHVVTTIDRATSNFFRGRVITCLIVGLLLAAGWTIVGVPYGLLLGLLGGLLNLVPFMSALSLPPALILTFLDHRAAGDWHWPVLLTLGVYLLVQTLESLAISPFVESQSSGLHPITTVVALLIGAELAGTLGLLLAIPVASTIKSLAAVYLLPEVRRLAQGAPDTAIVAVSPAPAGPSAEDAPAAQSHAAPPPKSP